MTVLYRARFVVTRHRHLQEEKEKGKVHLQSSHTARQAVPKRILPRHTTPRHGTALHGTACVNVLYMYKVIIDVTMKACGDDVDVDATLNYLEKKEKEKCCCFEANERTSERASGSE